MLLKVVNAFQHYRHHPRINKPCFSIVFLCTFNGLKVFNALQHFHQHLRINKLCFSIVFHYFQWFWRCSMLSNISASIPTLIHLLFPELLFVFSMVLKVFNAFQHFRQHPRINTHCFSMTFACILNGFKSVQCIPTLPPATPH